MAKTVKRVINLPAMLRAAETAGITKGLQKSASPPEATRKQIVTFFRIIGKQIQGDDSDARPVPLPKGLKLSPRMRQTLERLLAGDSEKQIATHLSVSQHTVHVYVKALYKGFDVNSRGELLSHFVQKTVPR